MAVNVNNAGMECDGVLNGNGWNIHRGWTKLLGLNVRFGEPECQVPMVRLKSDPLGALVATADCVLDRFDLRWHDVTAPGRTVAEAQSRAHEAEDRIDRGQGFRRPGIAWRAAVREAGLPFDAGAPRVIKWVIINEPWYKPLT
jgi:phosphoribosylamine-glycine ligase